MPPVGAAFETISLAKVAKSAAEAKELKFLRPTDGITMNRDRLLADAKARALKMLADGYKPPEPVELRLPGPTGTTGAEPGGRMASRLQGKALPHDVVGVGRARRGAHRRRDRHHRDRRPRTM